MENRYDFIVVGTGLAGLYSAYQASKYGKVALITKTNLDNSNSYWAQGGIAAVVSESDSFEDHVKDTLSAGRGLCSEEAVKILVEEGSKRVRELIELDLAFDKSGNNFELGLEGGHSKRRILHLGGDATGKEFVRFFLNLIKGNKSIDVFAHTFVFKLFVEENSCKGVHTYNIENGNSDLIFGNSVILATGGASGIYLRSTNPNTTTGDGIELAYEVGAEVSDLEFIQFHPTAFYSDKGRSFLISEAVRGEGAQLFDVNYERFMTEVHPKAELAPRDIVAKTIFYRMQETNSDYVYLSLKHLDSEKIYNRFKTIYKELKENGYDLTKDYIPVSPAAHYIAGGIKTDLNGQTAIKGLFACGEGASTGVHGANRLASNSLLECIVFGYRAVKKAKEITVQNFSMAEPNDFLVNEETKELYFSLKNEVKSVMTKFVGIVRNEGFLKTALEKFDEIEDRFEFIESEYYSIKLRNLINISRLITNSALMRKESRGGHYRDDFPEKDNRFIKHLVHIINEEPKFIDL